MSAPDGLEERTAAITERYHRDSALTEQAERRGDELRTDYFAIAKAAQDASVLAYQAGYEKGYSDALDRAMQMIDKRVPA